MPAPCAAAGRRLGLVALALTTMLACETPADDDLMESARPEEPVPSFGFPIPDRAAIDVVIGVDHDPEVHGSGIQSALCSNHDGDPFPACYDEHTGTDYTLRGGFDAMDAGSPDVVAAADGVVVDTQDGFFDRCRVQDFETWCGGGPIIANYIVVEHAEGWTTGYWHLQKGSVQVEVGDAVACGQVLGRIGSSGNSSLPHLHFEVWDPQGNSIDPYQGELSQAFSLWDEQDGPQALPGAGCTVLGEQIRR